MTSPGMGGTRFTPFAADGLPVPISLSGGEAKSVFGILQRVGLARK